MINHKISMTQYARIGGLIYLMIIIFGIVGQLVIRGGIVTMDATTTYQNLVASEGLWRMGLVGDVLMHLLDIPLMIIMYRLLKGVNKYLALLGVLFNTIQTAVLVVNKMTMVICTMLIDHPVMTKAFTAAQIKAQIYLLTDIHDYGFGLGLVFFGFACLTYGYLIYHSEYFPKILGLLLANAGLCYLINSLVLLLAPEYSENVFFVLLFSFIGELSFSLYLTIKGIRK